MWLPIINAEMGEISKLNILWRDIMNEMETDYYIVISWFGPSKVGIVVKLTREFMLFFVEKNFHYHSITVFKD